MEIPFVDVYYLLNRAEVRSAQEQANKLELISQLAVLEGANQAKKGDRKRAYEAVRTQVKRLVGENRQVLGEEALEQAHFMKKPSQK